MKNHDNQEVLKKMIKKYLAGKANPEEEAFLEAYFKHFETRENIVDQLQEHEKIQLGEDIEESILARISAAERPKVTMLPLVLKVAAAVLVFLSVGVYLYHSNRPEPAIATQHTDKADVAPGGNKAFLTLSDGRKISLDDARVGALTTEGNTVINKTADGKVNYQVAGSTVSLLMAYLNTIETPRGGEYQVTLSDGTRVWLNAASKLVFPTTFTGRQRNVELIGEAYFEVAKNESMPFKVTSGNQAVEVLGTHFNINAYPDEAIIKTTLLEGSVRVLQESTNRSQLLKPGQQAIVKHEGDILVSAVNTADAVAWKDGYFVFANDNLETVMRKISRWYDIDVQYTGAITKEAFVGSVSKFEKLSDVLSVMELTGMVHFEIEGRRVTVMP